MVLYLKKEFYQFTPDVCWIKMQWLPSLPRGKKYAGQAPFITEPPPTRMGALDNHSLIVCSKVQQCAVQYQSSRVQQSVVECSRVQQSAVAYQSIRVQQSIRAVEYSKVQQSSRVVEQSRVVSEEQLTPDRQQSP